MMVSWVPQNGFIGHRGGRPMRGQSPSGMAGRTLSGHLADGGDGNCLQAQTSALGRQETRETRKMKITRRDLLRSASATWATTILSKPASAAAEFEFKLGVNTPPIPSRFD
jgi:hypothetical protein